MQLPAGKAQSLMSGGILVKLKDYSGAFIVDFKPMFHFYTTWKYLMFSAGVKMERWLKIG